MSNATQALRQQLAESDRQRQEIREKLVEQRKVHEQAIAEIENLLAQVHEPGKAKNTTPTKGPKPAGPPPKERILQTLLERGGMLLALTGEPWLPLDDVQRELKDIDPSVIKSTLRGLAAAQKIKSDPKAEQPTYAHPSNLTTDEAAAPKAKTNGKPNGEANGVHQVTS
jgi:hypothetical protein